MPVETHGMSRRGQEHPLIKIWEGMIHRCESPNDVCYSIYGGRGISVCERWHDPRLFAEDIERDLGPRPAKWTLDRVDNDGNYEPGNVRWASAKMQAANRRPISPEVATARGRIPWRSREYRTLICLQCEQEYQTRAMSPNQKFCSKRCKAAWRRASGVDDVESICHQCGASFTYNKYESTKHCSRSCSVTCWHAGGCSGSRLEVV